MRTVVVVVVMCLTGEVLCLKLRLRTEGVRLLSAEWADWLIETKWAHFTSDHFVSFRLYSKWNEEDTCQFSRYKLSKPKCSVDSFRSESNRSRPYSFRSIKFRLIGSKHWWRLTCHWDTGTSCIRNSVSLFLSVHKELWVPIPMHKELRVAIPVSCIRNNVSLFLSAHKELWVPIPNA